MNERLESLERQPNKEQENAVFNRTLLLNGEPAADKIIERLMDFPIKRVIIFGEPGANKTTILLQLVSELMNLDESIEPNYIFYDNALAKVKKELGIEGFPTPSQYSKVSETLSREMNESFPSKKPKDKKRQIQFVELVGISGSDRGTSSLRMAAKRIEDQNPIEQDTLVIAVAADLRSLKDAGKLRRAISELEDPLQFSDELKKFNNFISGYPKGLETEEVAKRIKEFFGKMAPDHRIEIVHNEVMAQANRRVIVEDEYRTFRLLRLPTMPFPIETRQGRKDYLLNAAFLQIYLSELGLKHNMYSSNYEFRDSGVVIFSPYNPDIPKKIDLSRVLS